MRKARLPLWGVFLTALLTLAGCFAGGILDGNDEDWNWDAGNGKVYVRIPLPSEDGRAADFSYTFVKEYADYWEAVFQNTATPTEYYIGAAERGESYLVVAVTPGTYHILVLAGANGTGQSNGEKILLADGFVPSQTIVYGQRQVITVSMNRHITRVTLYEDSNANLFPSVQKGEEHYVYAIHDSDTTAFVYKAEISNLPGLISAAGNAVNTLAGQFQSPEIFACLDGIANTGAALFTPLVVTGNLINNTIELQTTIPPASIPVGRYTMYFNMRYYAFGTSASRSTRWNLRPGITYKTNAPLGGAVWVMFPMARGGSTEFVETGGGSYDELHIFKNPGTSALTFKPVVQLPVDNPEILVVAGGGGGGGGNGDVKRRGGGGGAGGLTHVPASAGYSLSVQTYSVTVGDGGSGSPGMNSSASNGGDSWFGGIQAIGGGRGSTHNHDVAGSGGSGGGGANSFDPVNIPGGQPVVPSIPSGAFSYGNKGGDITATGKLFSAAGGGGAGGAAADVSAQTTGSPGGLGMRFNITGQDLWYAAGGNTGGVTNTAQNPSAVAGGNADGATSLTNAEPGADHTGNGGGGGFGDPPNAAGGKGGSGVVVVRFRYTY